jgi:predicted esterase YcpF (UPF0227 family)
MTIFYLHGFGSAGASPKVDLIRAHFADEDVVSPDLPPRPSEAVALIRDLVTQAYARGETKFLFVGTSLGGFYAWLFSAKLHAPAILINPAIRPDESTRKHLGTQTNYATGAAFEWTEDDVAELADLRAFVEAHQDPELIHCVVALDDEVLDAPAIARYFGGRSKLHQFDDGGHRFGQFERVLPIVGSVYEGIRPVVDPHLPL